MVEYKNQLKHLQISSMDLVVGQYIRTLDSIFVDAKKIDKEDCELRSHMAKYLCIRVSGLMETFFKRQIANYLVHPTFRVIRQS